MTSLANLLPTESDVEQKKPISAMPTPQPAAMAPLSSTPRRTLWVRMAEIYGHRWTSAYGDDPEGQAAHTWAKGLAGLRPEQLASGLTSCLASADPWPPTLPEFRALCLGVPTVAQVLLELRPGAGRSGFTVLVWSLVDPYRYANLPSDRADRLVREAYELAREQVMRGKPVPDAAVPALERKIVVPVVSDPGAAREAMLRATAELSDADQPAARSAA